MSRPPPPPPPPPPRTPHPLPFPPQVEATIFYSVAGLELSDNNLNAINDLVRLKNGGIEVEGSKMASRVEYLAQKKVGGYDCGGDGLRLSKEDVRGELERLVPSDGVDYIVDVDGECKAVLAKVCKSRRCG